MRPDAGTPGQYLLDITVQSLQLLFELSGSVLDHAVGSGSLHVEAPAIFRDVATDSCEWRVDVPPLQVAPGELCASYECANAVQQPAVVGIGCNLEGVVLVSGCRQ